MTERSVFNV